MPERELTAARAKAEASKTALTDTIAELQHRLRPSTLASDAWHGVRDKGSDYADKGLHAVTGHPAAAGGAVAAVVLFLLRAPLASLVTGLFGSDRDAGRVTADLTQKDDDFDLTAPVVAKAKGA